MRAHNVQHVRANAYNNAPTLDDESLNNMYSNCLFWQNLTSATLERMNDHTQGYTLMWSVTCQLMSFDGWARMKIKFQRTFTQLSQ